MFTKIWERYFLKEFLKVFFLFLGCFYGLYVLIDYASHTSALGQHHIHIKAVELIRYYFYIFISRAEILIPLALLIALIRTLTTFNLRGELVAFLASGFKMLKLMRPFLIVGFICTIALFLNEQFLIPDALKKLRRIEDSTKHQRSHNHLSISAKNITLEDGSLFIFQSYDSSKEQFFDSYWIRSIDDIYRIKYLSPYVEVPTGYYVDHLKRKDNGELALEESFTTYPFDLLKFNREILQSTIIDPDVLSFKELWSQLPSFSSELNEKESKLLTSFYWKIIIPWLCILAIIAPIPFCIYFSRQFPLFLTYACGIFGLLAVYLFIDAASVIARRQVLDPFFALIIPFLSIFAFFVWRFYQKILKNG